MSAAVDTIEIQNVVASTGIDHELDLETLDEDLVGADFNPDNFSRTRVQNTGPPRQRHSFSGLEKSSAPAHQVLMMSMRRSISCSENSGILEYQSMILPEITVQNIVSSADLGEAMNLNAIAIGLGLEDVEYERTVPGLVYRMNNPEVVDFALRQWENRDHRRATTRGCQCCSGEYD